MYRSIRTVLSFKRNEITNVSFRNLFRSVPVWFVYFGVIRLYRQKHYVPVSTIYLCFFPFSVFNLVTDFVSFDALIPLIWYALLCSFFVLPLPLIWSALLVFRSSPDYLKFSFKVSVLPLIIWFLWFLLLFTSFFFNLCSMLFIILLFPTFVPFSFLLNSAILNVCALC